MKITFFHPKLINSAMGMLRRHLISAPSMRGHLKRLRSRGFYPKHVLDVGAAHGDWSLMCSKIFPDSDFLLVEPLEEYEKSLQKTRKKICNARYILTAVGSFTGETAIFVQKDLVGSSILHDSDPRFPGVQRTVPIVTADNLITQTGSTIPDLVKVDIQCYELEFLQGASSLLHITEVFILEASLFRFLDGSPLIHEVIEYMTTHGYMIDDIVGHLYRPSDGALGQVDIAFVKSDSFLRKSILW